jgi:general L-amino acid transport system substrate-binding protein
MSGFDVDFCRAVAGAIFDDPSKVNFVPLSASERFNALRAGRVDLLSRNSTT